MEPLLRQEKKIARKAGRAIHEFGMIDEGDAVLAGLSGGASSWALLHVLERLRKNAPVRFTVTAIALHDGSNEGAVSKIASYCEIKNIPLLAEKTTGTEKPDEVLRRFARTRGFTRIALGHHADDLVEALLAAQFFGGETSSLPPVSPRANGEPPLIRPLCRVFGEEIEKYAALSEFPAASCGYPLQGSPKEDEHREKVRKMLLELEISHPGIKANLLSCLGRVRERYLMHQTCELNNFARG